MDRPLRVRPDRTPTAPDAPFWKRKTLDEMSSAEWESLCDGCGRCCLVKLEDEDTGRVHYTDVACRLLDPATCRCRSYETRQALVPDCLRLTPEAVRSVSWLPPTCAYRLVGEGRDLADWHPLVSGDPAGPERAGITVRGRLGGSEEEFDGEELMDRVVRWPARTPRRPARQRTEADAAARPELPGTGSRLVGDGSRPGTPNHTERAMGFFSSPIKTFDDLYTHQLEDIYYAENQITKALPKMIDKAQNPALKQAFQTHLGETEEQVKRLDKVFELLGKPAKGATCPAIDGIIKEAQELISDCDDGEVRDAAMLAAAQAVEHYEITRYGTLIAWSRQLGKPEVARLLAQTLAEEKTTDEKLTTLGESNVNRKAA